MICITHLTSAHPPFDIRIFHKECKSLANSGYNVILVVPCHKDDNKDGVRIKAVPIPKGRLERMTVTIYHLLRAAWAVNADIYHFHDPELIILGCLLKLLGKRVIYDVHENVPYQNLDRDWIVPILRRPLSLIIDIIERSSAYIFDGIITATPAIAQRFPRHKTQVVQNYPVLGELTAEYTSPHNNRANQAVYVGAISEARGLYEMINAIAQVPESYIAKLVFAGSIDNVSLQAVFNSFQSVDQVKFIGLIGRNEVCDLLSQSKVGLVLFHRLANHIDAQPNKLFEYMSSGLPVIASDFPLWREIIEKNNCGILVDPMDSSEIAKAIQWVFDNPEEAEKMGKNGHKAVLYKYNWDIEKEKLIKIYSDLTREILRKRRPQRLAN